MKKQFGLILALAGAYGVVQRRGSTAARRAGPFTAAQADAGRTAYQANCASCHNADLSGSGNAAPLAGSLFMGGWGNRTTEDLVGFMQGAMPPTNPGGLTEATYLNIAAFILQYNGSRPGNQALTATTSVGIGTVATGSSWRRSLRAPEQEEVVAAAAVEQAAVVEARADAGPRQRRAD